MIGLSMKMPILLLFFAVAFSGYGAVHVPVTIRAQADGDTATLQAGLDGPIGRTYVGFQIREAGKRVFRRAGPHLIFGPISKPDLYGFSQTLTVKIDTDYEFRSFALVNGVRRFSEIRAFYSGGFPPTVSKLTADLFGPTSVRLS